MNNSLQQAWQWLVPPVVEDGAGKLIARRQLAASPTVPSGVLPSLQSVQQELLGFDVNLSNPHVSSAVDAIEIEDDAGDMEPDLPAHPDASHSAVLQEVEVFYLLRRSSRRSIGFSVGAKGLEVTAPQRVALRDVESALQSKAAWIVRKLQEAGQREAHRAQSSIEWRDGGVLDYLGLPLVLRLSGDGPEGLRTRQTHREQRADGSQSLHLPLPQEAAKVQVRAAVQAWILREARSHFTARLLYFAPVVGVRWNALRLTSARTRWGSANSDGMIRLNWRLLQHAPQVIDYVVVHELAHLHHMDHSPQFWSEVAKVLPDWKSQRNALKNYPLPSWD
ncbi:SprT family zinc-dependent metalloprotease [Comamonas aquatilis]|uniref:M48 family metallopeptidase n=1 Tax=Comamonas aquatilis TaxID=1778406 RepID=UPI0039EF1237